MVTVEELCSTEQEIHALVKVRAASISWLLYAVYASPRLAERKLLWSNLTTVASKHKLPRIITGDFNEVLSRLDKKGGLPVVHARINAFHDCLNACNTLDLSFIGA